MPQIRPWSKLKARVEGLWEPSLDLAIHCTAYTNSITRRDHRFSRHWLVLDKNVIWDFPGQFVGSAEPCVGPPYPGNGGSVIGELLRQYIDRPLVALFDPFPEDGWELTDLLRAADRRIGKRTLADWGKELGPDNPAHRILQARFAS